MKKLSFVFVIFMLIFLVGCSGGESSRTIIVDEPATEINEALKLDSVKNGVVLNSSVDKTIAYSQVYISSDAKSSLFYDVIELDDYLNDRFKSLSVKVLFFNSNIPADDALSFIDVMNNEEYGLSESRVGHQFSSNGVSLFGKLSLSQQANLPEEYEVKDNDPTNLVVVYLPTYCIYSDGNQIFTKVFLMIPVYYAYTYASEVNNYTSGLKKYQIELVDGVLPSAEVIE